MRRYKIAPFLLFMCLLAGCQQAPDEVLERMENYGKESPIEEVQQEGYCTVEELREAAIDDIDHEPDNLELPSQVDFSGIESIGLLTVKRYEDYEENKENVAEFFGVDIPEWEMVGEENQWYQYSDADIYLAVDDNGEISYICGESYDNLSNEQWLTIVSQVHLGREDCPELTCRLEDGDIRLSDVLKNMQEWVDENELLQDEFDYELRTAYVGEKPDGGNMVDMTFQCMYKGVGLSYIAFGNGGMDMKSLPYIGPAVTIAVDDMSSTSFYVDQDRVYVAEETPLERVVDFKSAVELVEQKLAGFSRLKVCEIRAEYFIRAEVGENPDNNQSMAGAVLHARPYYCFFIEVDVDDTTLGSREGNRYVYVCVDMEDGSVMTNFEEMNFHG